MTTPLPIDAETISRRRGDTKPFVFTIKDVSDVLVDLTGFTFLMTADPEKYPITADNNIFQLTGASTTDGIISFPITAGEADLLGTYYFDAQVIDALGIITTIVSGKVKFIQDITK